MSAIPVSELLQNGAVQESAALKNLIQGEGIQQAVQDDAVQTDAVQDKAMFVCSKDTLEGAYPALVMAINAARLGMKTRVFYTFMGVNVVRKDGAQNAKYFPPGFLGAIPGMAHLASGMMKKKIEDANIPSLDDLLEMVRLEGVKLTVCHMTAEMMGLSEDDFIEDVEVWTAEALMKYAQEAKVCLFT